MTYVSVRQKEKAMFEFLAKAFSRRSPHPADLLVATGDTSAFDENRKARTLKALEQMYAYFSFR